ncbi:hypothetical protein [Komagataeibacter xylinus]|nr:hypothetical protein [Komagataeibacter xylinus]
MMMPLPGNDTGPAVLHFPRRAILPVGEASDYLGIRPRHLRAMRLLRCGPKTITINRETLYTEEDLRSFRQGLLNMVGVTENGGLYRELRPGERTTATEGDPLIVLLSRHIIRRKALLVGLWSMMAVGIGIDLILF